MVKLKQRRPLSTHPKCEVVSPGQEHNSCVIFLYMCEEEVQKHIPQYEKHSNWW